MLLAGQKTLCESTMNIMQFTFTAIFKLVVIRLCFTLTFQTSFSFNCVQLNFSM